MPMCHKLFASLMSLSLANFFILILCSHTPQSIPAVPRPPFLTPSTSSLSQSLPLHASSAGVWERERWWGRGGAGEQRGAPVDGQVESIRQREETKRGREKQAARVEEQETGEGEHNKSGGGGGGRGGGR